MVGASNSTSSTVEHVKPGRRWRPPAWTYSLVAGCATYWVTVDGGNNVAIPAAATVTATVQALVASRER